MRCPFALTEGARETSFEAGGSLGIGRSPSFRALLRSPFVCVRSLEPLPVRRTYHQSRDDTEGNNSLTMSV
jgi:hypothetical protein